MRIIPHHLSTVLSLTVAIPCFGLPSISVQPADESANQGFNATFQAEGTGVPPLSYQWFYNSNAIGGANSNLLNVANAQPANAGAYFAVVTDSSGTATSRVATLTVTLPASLNPKVGKNIRLGHDSTLLPGLNQGEIHIARSYSEPNAILATFQDGIGASHRAAFACSFVVSADGGLTWHQDLLPGFGYTSGGQNGGGANHVATFDTEGNPYISSLIGPPLGPSNPGYASQMVVYKSGDGGRTFGSPFLALTGVPSKWPDKEWIAINAFQGAPHPDRIALAYTQGESFPLNSYSIFSDDGGRNWSAPKFISTLALGVQNLFLPDGSLAVLYWKFVADAYDEGAQRLAMVLSKDGGATFAAPTVVMDTKNFRNPDTNDFAARFFTSACTDRQAGVIYATVGAETGPPGRRINQILFTRSIDQGKTWSAPIQVNDTPPGKRASIPAIAASPDGQHVTIEFYDKRNDTGEDVFVDLYLAESFDAGETWEPNLRLSEFSSDLRKAPMAEGFDQYFLGDYQGMVPSLNFDTPAVAAWIDTRAGNSDPYVVRIHRTKGTTFEAWRKLRFSANDLADALISGASADPDHDEIANITEYALGLEPNRVDENPIQFAIHTLASVPMLDLSYEVLAVLGDVSIFWEESLNLVDWTTIKPAAESISSGRDLWMKRIDISFPASNQKRFFRYRLKLEGPTQQPDLRP